MTKTLIYIQTNCWMPLQALTMQKRADDEVRYEDR